jgi:hypothetical protein
MADTLHEVFSKYQTEFAAATSLEEQQRAYAEFSKDRCRLELEQLREVFLRGGTKAQEFEPTGSSALMRAIELCGSEDIPLPRWAADAFSKAIFPVFSAKVASWDEAFGRPWPKRTDLAAVRRRMRMMQAISLRVRALHEDGGRALDHSLFEDVGKEFGIGRSLCGNLYRQEKRRLGGLPYAVRVPQKPWPPRAGDLVRMKAMRSWVGPEGRL